MELSAVVFMVIGLGITWGGLFTAIYIQSEESKK